MTPFAEGSARVWDVRTGALISELAGDPSVAYNTKGYLSGAWLTHDGARVVTIRKELGATVWDAGTGQQLFDLEGSAALSSSQPVFADSGIEVAFQHHPAVWSLDTGKISRTASINRTEPERQVWAAWSSDLLQINTGQAVVDARTGGPIASVQLRNDLACGSIAAWSGSGGRVVTWVPKGSVTCLFDGRTGQFIKGLELQHQREVLRVYFLAGDSRVLTVAPDDAPQLWDAETGHHVASLGTVTRPEERSWLDDGTPVSFSADRYRIATAHFNGHIRVWDATTGFLLAEFDTGGPMRGVALSPDGLAVAAPSVKGKVTDSVARVWPLFGSSTDLTRDAKQALPRCLSARERRENFLDDIVPDWCFEHKKWPTLPIRVGVTFRSPADPDCTTCGAIVGRVMRHLPGHVAGLAAGDVITALNGEPVGSWTQFNELIGKVPVGASTVIRVLAAAR